MIQKKGISSIPDEDLQDLCRERGMRAIGLTRKRLEEQYLDWIELASDPKISDSMLAYTRMLYMPKAVPQMADAMEKAIEDKKRLTSSSKSKEKSADKGELESELEGKDDVFEEPDFVDKAPLIHDIDSTPAIDKERARLDDRVAKMKISLKDIEAVLEAISATKKLLKPLAATQV